MTLKNYGAIGRAGSPLPAAGCNERVLVHRDGAHGVTRPTMTGPIKAAPRKVLVAVRHRRRNSSHEPVRRRNTTVFQGIFALPAVIGMLLIFRRKHPNQDRRQNGGFNQIISGHITLLGWYCRGRQGHQVGGSVSGFLLRRRPVNGSRKYARGRRIMHRLRDQACSCRAGIVLTTD